MNYYDLVLLMEKVYIEGITNQGLSPETLDEIRVELDNSKPKIDSVFGVQLGTDYEDEEILYIYVSDTLTWKKDGHCSDRHDDNSFDVLTNLGFAQEMEGVYSSSIDMIRAGSVPSKEDIISKLISLGFEYDEKFEIFMKDCLEE